jgi:5-methylcytosine-specific restriction endonuclease McrA
MKRKLCQRCVRLDCVCKVVVNEGQTTRNGYSRKWRRFREMLFRKRVRTGRSMCNACGLAFGSESPHADHIVPVLNEDDPLFYCEDNVQFLHPSCHAKKTAMDVKSGMSRRSRRKTGIGGLIS